MREAADYATWRAAAEDLDTLQGLDEWKQEEASEDYDWKLIKSRLGQIRQFREQGRIDRLVHHLRQGLHWNLGNIGNPALYGRARTGTKQLVQDYVEEVVEALQFLADTEFDDFNLGAKRRFFAETAQSYGRSALMLSGGATLGLFHVGVVKALAREDLLPDVISGSSAGAVVASAVGTRAPDELDQLLDPRNAFHDFWKLLSLREIWRKGVLMDQNQVRKAIAANIRDLSFEESYRLSGRVINITVSPAGSNQPPRLLNYLTFPYLFVREAVLASCAVPFLFEPVMLTTRDETGRRVPYMPSLSWTDGTLKSDLPGIRLRRLHNVNHFIVSQTNPHVIPFLRQRPGRGGLGGALRDFAVSTAFGHTANLLKLAGALPIPLAQPRRYLEHAVGILEQNYQGNVTIVPKLSIWRYANVTANPGLELIERFVHEGERATWERMSMIRYQTLISRTLDRCLRRLDEQLALPQREPQRRATLSVVRSKDT
jgi:NTE family protein